MASNQRITSFAATHRPAQDTLSYRPSPLKRENELQAQQKQLRKRRCLDATSRELYPARRAELDARLQEARVPSGAAHRRSLSTLAPSPLGRSWQSFLTKFVHPAASFMPPRKWAIGQAAERIEEGIDTGWARRTTFWAEDEGAAQLDGLLIAKTSVEVAWAQRRPCLFVVAGFAMTYEAIVPQAKGLADDFDVLVVLHNSRGVDRSLGTQRSIDEATQDCKAVVRHLLAAGHTHLAAYGVSMGSATALRTVAQMAADGELKAGDIGLAASVRGLSSIPNVVGALLGAWFGAASQWLLWRANLPDMDVTRVLQVPLLNHDLLITTAAKDGLVKGKGQLAQCLGLQGDGRVTLPSGQAATLITNHGVGHNDPNVRTPNHDAALRKWVERAQDRATTSGRADVFFVAA